MGTGIVAILLFLIPFHASWLYYLSLIFFILNAFLFALGTGLTVLRYLLYPRVWPVMLRDPVDPLFLATCLIGFATLIEMWIFICVPIWGQWATTLAWVAWMIDTAFSVVTTVAIAFLL